MKSPRLPVSGCFGVEGALRLPPVNLIIVWYRVLLGLTGMKPVSDKTSL